MRRRTFVCGILAFMFVLVSMSGCSVLQPKTMLNAEEFREKMTDAGFTITDATSQFEAGDVETVLIATSDDYQIEFYVMPSVARAETAFAVNQSDFGDMGSGGSSTSTNGSNYNYYSRTTSSHYYAVLRIENTFIYVAEEVEDKEAIRATLKLLGY